jgi:hypothetical protein
MMFQSSSDAGLLLPKAPSGAISENRREIWRMNVETPGTVSQSTGWLGVGGAAQNPGALIIPGHFPAIAASSEVVFMIWTQTT